MQDKYYREIDYARISITDYCNLSCRYCKSEADAILEKQVSQKQLFNLIDVLDELKFRKIRFTGGEPLLNDWIVSLVEYTNNKEHIKDIGLTTNAVLLDKYLDALIKAGLKRINISLDTLDDNKYYEITKTNYLQRVKDNIALAVASELIVKVNVVLLKGVNDNEIVNFLEFGRLNNVQIRFIELMPIGENDDFIKDKQLNIRDKFKNYQSREKKPNCKDVSDYYIDEYGYCFGIISPISNHFCERCNRIRFTSDGKLRLCLHSDNELDIYEYLNKKEELKALILNYIKEKPEKHYLNENMKANKGMSKIGG
ncbi:GTP 3',8-cyclase MoaA [Erysipelotrichaceae bacterium OttesenSCG-928-M19]|nr:GTP 3',8-cyclase MoaA [Erysipelotrichaceae bacterium OttesenSCG-928-M19]